MELDHARLDVYQLALDFLVISNGIIEGLSCLRARARARARIRGQALSDLPAALARNAVASADGGGHARPAVDQIAAAVARHSAVDVLHLAALRHAAARRRVGAQALAADAGGAGRAGSAVDRVAAAVAGRPAGEPLCLAGRRGARAAVG